MGAPDPGDGVPALAVGGKAVRGPTSHGARVLLAQREIAAMTTEIPELAPLLAGQDLIGVVVTADALHAQRETARHLVADRQAAGYIRGHWSIENRLR